MYALKTTDEGIIKVNLDISPEFFMSDPHYKANVNTDYPKPEPYLYIVAEESENEYLGNLYEGDDVKIINFEYDSPIENEYK
jgi:heat shock protein HspQ